MDDIENIIDSEIKEIEGVSKEIEENNTSSWDKSRIKWDRFKKSYDWGKIPLHMLIFAILVIGAYLMGTSVYLMTGSLIVAILSPAFSELGLTAAHFASERPKNSVRQTEISRKLRGWHIFTSVILLMMNLVVETITSNFDLQIDGLLYVIFGVIGLTSLIDIVSYFRFQDADDELVIKNTHAKKMESIKKNTIQKKLSAYADIEEVKSSELVKFYQEHAPELARRKARLEAAYEIDKMYVELGMSPEKAKNLLESVGFAESEVVNETKALPIPSQSQESQRRSYVKSGKYRRPELPSGVPPIPQPEQKEELNFPEQGETVNKENLEKVKNAEFD